MAINKKLIHFKNYSTFLTELNNKNLLDTSIVFILDAKKIWTHGTEYDASTYTLPIASGTVLGGIKIGDHITINNGMISLTKENVTDALGYTPPTADTTYDLATNTKAGIVTIGTAAGLANTTNGSAGSVTGGKAASVDHTHPLQTTISGNAGSASKLLTARGIKLSGDVSSESIKFNGLTDIEIPTVVANDSHTHSNSTITSLDASKITSGTIDIARLPKGALERLTVVADDTARLALTSNDVQSGDTIKVTSTGLMYYVKDTSALGTEAAYEIYTAGSATSVPWTGVTGKPSTYTPSEHTHNTSDITSGILPISRGGTGRDSNPKVLVNLASESTADIFATDPRPGVTGILPASHGGTGYTTLKSSASALINALDTASSTPSDNDYIVVQYANGGTTNTQYYRKSVSKIYDYIKSKTDALYLGKTATATAANKLATAVTVALTGAVTGSASFDGSGNLTINTNVNHTHNYAGSSSAGGAATSANKLNTNAGSEINPVYFANGVPVKCTHELNSTVPENAVFTDNSVTSADNHYAPVTQADKALSAAASSTTNATWGTTNLVTGVNLSRDAKGHVTDISVTSIKMPANPNTDTHWTTGIKAGASGTNSNSALTNPYIKVLDNTTYRSQIQLKGSGATTVSSDANGVITIHSANTTYEFTNNNPTLAWGQQATIGTAGGTEYTLVMPANPNTDTHYTTNIAAGGSAAVANAVATNPYITIRDNSTYRSLILLIGSGATTVKSDATGKITISSTDTTYSAGNGLTLSSTTFNVGAGTGINVAADSISVKYGTAAGTAAQGNDSRLSDARNPKTTTLTSEDLNNITTPGFYAGGGSNTVTNKPSGVDAFGLHVFKTAGGYTTQQLTEGNTNPGCRWTRQHNASSWSSWIPMPTFTATPTSGLVVVTDGTTGKIKSSGYTIASSVPSGAKFTDTTYTAITASELNTGTATTSRVVTAKVLSDYVSGKVSSLIDSAPDTLNTLNELAAALGDDPNFATTITTELGKKVDKVSGKGLSTNDYTTAEKNKLSGIATGAEVNQNAFAKVVVGSTTISADSKTDTLTLVAGSNVTITPDATNDKITIAAEDTKYSFSASNPTLAWGTTSTIGTAGGTTYKVTMPANPNSDTKVKQTVTTTNAAYPLLLAPSGQTATATTTSYFDSGVTLNPSTNTIAANISGNAATATKVGSSTVGSATRPVYISSGTPTACTYTLGKSVPSNAVFTDTTYSAGSGLTLSGTTFNVGAGTGISVGDDTVSLAASGVTAGKYGDDEATRTLTHSDVFDVPYITVDAYGRVTSASTKTLTLPASGNTDTKVTQTVTTTNANYPLLFAPSGQTATTTTSSYFNTGIYANASTKSLYATHFYETSDINFKTNIEYILDSNNCPKVRLFDWKEDGTHAYGFIAQELEEQGYKELVDTDEEGKKTVNYSAALSLTVGKMQKKIEELEKKILELENKLLNINNIF